MKYFSWLMMFVCASILSSMATANPLDDVIEIRATKPIQLRSDRGYILMRSLSSMYGPTLMRVPTEIEMDEYIKAKQAAFNKALPSLMKDRERQIEKQPAANIPMPDISRFSFQYDKVVNLQNVNMGATIERNGNYRTFLLEVLPGDYVVYGIGYKNAMPTCLCLGTVQFAVPAGEVRDIGEIIIDTAGGRSPYPELANETGLGDSMSGHNAVFSLAIRPFNNEMKIPDVIKGNFVKPAEFHAVGRFITSSAFSINRLAPIAGVLSYDRGDVIDASSGKMVANHY